MLLPDGGCLFSSSIAFNAPDKIDLLFEVDDSPSMVMAQAHLAAQIPRVVTMLTTGDLNGDGIADFTPVTDLHAGVITVNMGVGGIPDVPTCMTHADFGDDGILLDTARVGGSGCMASYPRFLSFTTGTSPTQFATDFTCLARTGVGGCGFEQQLDASLKAVLPSTSSVTFYAGTHGHGDDPATNGGFLRSDSIVAILDITDEDDCSTDQVDIWNPASTTHTGDLNLRCINYFDELYPVQRFIDGFKSLRADPNLVIFATITGVPQDLVTLPDPTASIDYARVLADPRMQNVIVTSGGSERLQHSCEDTSGDGYFSVPGIRMTQVAQGFGDSGLVQSICEDDWAPLLSGVVQRIANNLGVRCLPRAIDGSAGTVPCTLDVAFVPGAGGSCADLVPGATRTATDTDGTVHCQIPQLTVSPSERASGTAPSGAGWYYDDYTPATLAGCGATPQRLQVNGVTPPMNARASLLCAGMCAP